MSVPIVGEKKTSMEEMTRVIGAATDLLSMTWVSLPSGAERASSLLIACMVAAKLNQWSFETFSQGLFAQWKGIDETTVKNFAEAAAQRAMAADALRQGAKSVQ
jgi:hypothetical protein